MHITKFFESFVQGSKLFIVMEYVGGGSVRDAIKRRGGSLGSEVYIAVILREVLLGVSFLHGLGKIHRDIKCANILLNTDGSQAESTAFNDTMFDCSKLHRLQHRECLFPLLALFTCIQNCVETSLRAVARLKNR